MPTSIFVNYAGKDFRLAAPTTVGSPLVSPYNKDLLGNTRGVDGSWDRGAYEYTGIADATPPVISNPGASSVLTSSAVIAWTTDEAASTIVEYGPTMAYGSTVTNISLLTSHVLTLTGLASDTSYNYRVRSADAAGNLSTSGNFTFRTGVADLTAPSVTLTAPANGATLNNIVSLAATATDNIGVVGVKFFANGVELSDITVSPYTYAWDTTWVANGSYTIYAQARDASGNLRSSATNTVTVNNPTGTVPNAAVYWDFNAGTGTSATDSLSANVLTFRNGLTWTNAGKFGAGLSLDGVNDRADAPNSTALDITGNTFSVATWVKLESTANWQQILVKVKETGTFTAPYFAWHLFGGHASSTQWTPMFQLVNDSDNSVNASSSVSVNYGEWVHLVGVYDGTAVRIYVNGVERGNAAQTGNLRSYAQPLYVGAHGQPAEFAKGVIDEVRIYPRALTATQVQSLYLYTPAAALPAAPTSLRVVLN
ncbi:MAG: Ig-like domain-containing protein [Verrucomicrobiota bacterium]